MDNKQILSIRLFVILKITDDDRCYVILSLLIFHLKLFRTNFESLRLCCVGGP